MVDITLLTTPVKGQPFTWTITREDQHVWPLGRVSIDVHHLTGDITVKWQVNKKVQVQGGNTHGTCNTLAEAALALATATAVDQEKKFKPPWKWDRCDTWKGKGKPAPF